jgi:hypothetical protein
MGNSADCDGLELAQESGPGRFIGKYWDIVRIDAIASRDVDLRQYDIVFYGPCLFPPVAENVRKIPPNALLPWLVQCDASFLQSSIAAFCREARSRKAP